MKIIRHMLLCAAAAASAALAQTALAQDAPAP